MSTSKRFSQLEFWQRQACVERVLCISQALEFARGERAFRLLAGEQALVNYIVYGAQDRTLQEGVKRSLEESLTYLRERGS